MATSASADVEDFVGRLTYGGRVLEGLIPRAAEREGRIVLPNLPRGAAPIHVERAFEDAVGGLKALVRRHKGGLITIGVDDHTRPNVHTRELLPRLLRFLRDQGVPRDRLRVIVAGGTHRSPRPAEFATILGEDVWRGYADIVESHDSVQGVAGLGLLEDGVPVEFNATAARAAIHVALTDLDYHYFAGVAGGPKQIMPGLAGQAVITAEHLRMFGDLGFAANVEAGVIEGNPVYEYKRKVLAVIRGHFDALGHDLYGVACVVDPEGRLVHLAGGDVETTHRDAIPVLDAVYTATVSRTADVVLQGARSLGVNLYQAGKAFNAAKQAVRAGGRILVAAPLPDGWGNDEFERLMKLVGPLVASARKNPSAGDAHRREAIDAMLRHVQDAVTADFRIGKQKPVDLLVTLRHVGWDGLHLVSEGVPPEDHAALPIVFVGRNEEDPVERVRGWTAGLEDEAPTYLVSDDPGLRVRLAE